VWKGTEEQAVLWTFLWVMKPFPERHVEAQLGWYVEREPARGAMKWLVGRWQVASRRGYTCDAHHTLEVTAASNALLQGGCVVKEGHNSKDKEFLGGGLISLLSGFFESVASSSDGSSGQTVRPSGACCLD
jgi:hypothetical protein